MGHSILIRPTVLSGFKDSSHRPVATTSARVPDRLSDTHEPVACSTFLRRTLRARRLNRRCRSRIAHYNAAVRNISVSDSWISRHSAALARRGSALILASSSPTVSGARHRMSRGVLLRNPSGWRLRLHTVPYLADCARWPATRLPCSRMVACRIGRVPPHKGPCTVPGAVIRCQ